MKTLTMTICVLSAAVLMAGQRYDWNGGASGDWNTAANWSPNGVPTNADDVYIDGGADAAHVVTIDIGNGAAKEASASCWSIHLSGHVTFSNSGAGYLDVAGYTGSTRPVYTEKGGVYTFNCPLYLSSNTGSSEILTWHGTTYLNGGYRYNWGAYFFFGGGYDTSGVHTAGELHINGGLEPLGSGGYSFVALVFGSNYGATHIDRGNNWFYRIQQTSRHGSLHVNCDNPWETKASNYEYTHIAGGTHIYLHGHDVTFPKHTYFGNDADVGYGFTSVIDTDEGMPATLTIQQLNTTLFRTNNTVNFTGPLTLKMTEDSVGTQALNRQIDTTGAIIIEGGVWDLCANASFPNISSLRVSKNGRIRLASGVSYAVPKLYLGEGDFQVEAGTYGAEGNPNADFTSEYFEGEGLLAVADTEADTYAATWNGQGGNNSVWTMANWVGTPASLPFSNGGLLPTFATGGAMAQVADDVRFKGVVFDSAADFTLSGSGLVKLGSLGVETKAPAAGTRSYTINAPVKLNEDQTWALAAGTTVTVPQAVSGLGSVTLSGAGALVLAANNSFSGSLTINQGDVDATGASFALGRANGENYTAATVYVDQRTASLHVKDATIEKNLKTYGAGDSGSNAKLILEGTNVLKGDYLTVQGDYMRFRPNAVLNVYGEMTGWGYTYFAPKSDNAAQQGEIYAYGPVTIANFSPQSVQFHFCTNGSHVSRFEVSNGGTLHFHCPFVNTFTDNYVFQNGAANIDLHGNSQIFGSLYLNNATGTITSGEEGPATMFIHHTETGDSRVNTNGDLAGRLSISMGGGGQLNNNKALSTAGDLTVTNGTWNFMANGSWLNGTNVTASGVSDGCKGRIVLAQSQTLGTHARVALDGKGSLELAAGVLQRCAALRINGTGMPPGTYGSTASGAQYKDDIHFAGTGVLNVRGNGTALIFR